MNDISILSEQATKTRSTWTLKGTINRYTVWHNGSAYQIPEPNHCPSDTDPGHPKLETILQLRALRMGDFIAAP